MVNARLMLCDGCGRKKEEEGRETRRPPVFDVGLAQLARADGMKLSWCSPNSLSTPWSFTQTRPRQRRRCKVRVWYSALKRVDVERVNTKGEVVARYRTHLTRLLLAYHCIPLLSKITYLGAYVISTHLQEGYEVDSTVVRNVWNLLP